jgi:hypothetical protein
VWFSLLALPPAVIGTSALGFALWQVLATSAPLSLSLAGSGVIFSTSAMMLLCGGAIGELVYKLGDVREADFSRLTQQIWPAGTGSPAAFDPAVIATTEAFPAPRTKLS